MNKPYHHYVAGLVLGSIVSFNSNAIDNTAVNENIRKQLEQAKIVLQEAEKAAEGIIRDAQSEANKIVDSAKSSAVAVDLTPLDIKNTKVAIEINAGTIEEIVNAIMPNDWRILVDVKDEKITKRRFQFVSNRSREQALNDLLSPIGMRHQYFFNLKDSSGKDSPLLIVSTAN